MKTSRLTEAGTPVIYYIPEVEKQVPVL